MYLYTLNVQQYNVDNGDVDCPASVWSSWSADVPADLGHRSSGHGSYDQKSSVATAGMTSQPGAHLRRHGDDMTSDDVSSSCNVPSANDSEYRLSTPTTPVAVTCENVSWSAL